MVLTNKYRFDYHYQVEVLKVCVQDQIFLKSYPGTIQPSYFSTEDLMTIARVLMDFFDKYSEVPAYHILKQQMSEYFVKYSVAIGLQESINYAIDVMYGQAVVNRQTVLDTVCRFAREQSLKRALGETLTILETGGDLDEATNKIVTASTVGTKQREAWSFFEKIKEMPNLVLSDKAYSLTNRIPTPFRQMNLSTFGGPGPGQIWVVAAKPKGGKCLKKSAKVWNPNFGYVSIGDFKVNSDTSVSVGEVASGTGIVPIIAKEENGIKDVYDVHLASGRVIRGITGNHPIRGFDGYINVSDVTPGMAIAAPGKLNINTLSPWENPKLGYVLGAFLGDGAMTTGYPVLTQGVGRDDVVNGIIESLPESWNLVARRHGLNIRFIIRRPIVKKNGESRNKLVAWFNSLGLLGLNSYTKYIPKEVWTGGYDVIRQVIAGLIDTDGSVYSKNNYSGIIEYTSMSEQLADAMLTMLHTLGIYAQKDQHSTNKAWRVSISGRPNLRKFRDLVPIRVQHKKARLDTLCNRITKSIDKGSYYDRLPKECRKYMPATMRKKSRLSKEFFKKYASYGDMEFAFSCHWDAIDRVEYAGKEETYDLQSSDDSMSFVTEGIIVHNSTVLINFAMMALLHGKCVYHYSFGDMSKMDVMMRYTNHISGRTTEEIQSNNDYVSLCDNLKKSCPNADLQVIYESPLVMDVQDIYQDLSWRVAKSGRKPDFIVIDYANKLKMEFADSTYRSMSIIYGGLKGLGDMFDCPVFTGVQLKRDAKRDDGSPEDVADSWMQIADCDAFIIVNQNETEADKGEARLSMPIVRRGVALKNFKVSFNKALCRVRDTDRGALRV